MFDDLIHVSVIVVSLESRYLNGSELSIKITGSRLVFFFILRNFKSTYMAVNLSGF